MVESEFEDRELFDHLVAEFGDRGRDAVGFLETAQRLVAEDAALDLPRGAGAAAYCVREALQRLLPPEAGRPSWKKLSNEVLDARKRFEAVRGLPGADEAGALEELLAAIDRLGEFKRDEQGLHERRLAGLIEARTGAPPLSVPLGEYQRLISEINDDAVHSSVSVEQVREFLGRALSVLRTVFAPFQLRRPDLDALAHLPDPGAEDVQRLRSVCSTPHHLSYFMQQAVAPKWLSLLAPEGALDPPPGGGAWPVLLAVERLAHTHPTEVAAWLEDMYARWGVTETGAAYIAAAARGCLPAASATLLRALSDHPRTHWIRAQAAHALEVMDPTSRFIDGAAEVLLDPNDEVALAGTAQPAIRALLKGMTPENADTRIVLLASKLAASTEARYWLFLVASSGSVEDIVEEEGSEAGVLLKGVLAAVLRAREIGLPTDRILALLEPIPGGLLARLRAWALHAARDAPPEVLVGEITHAICDRDPTGDDVRLIQRIETEASRSLYAASWQGAMGSPPTPEEVGRVLASHEVPPEWQRAGRWHPLLPDAVREAWDTTVTLMSPVLHTPTREEYLAPPPSPGAATRHLRASLLRGPGQDLRRSLGAGATARRGGGVRTHAPVGTGAAGRR